MYLNICQKTSSTTLNTALKKSEHTPKDVTSAARPSRMISGTQRILPFVYVNGAAAAASDSDSDIPVCADFKAYNVKVTLSQNSAFHNWETYTTIIRTILKQMAICK